MGGALTSPLQLSLPLSRRRSFAVERSFGALRQPQDDMLTVCLQVAVAAIPCVFVLFSEHATAQ
jgi:hypothetical protein